MSPLAKPCLNCGTEMLIRPSHFEETSYCSKECMAIGYRTRLRDKANPNYRNAGHKICAECGKDFRSYNNQRKYCSKSCSIKRDLERLRGQAREAGLRGGMVKHLASLQRQIKNCVICGSKFRSKDATTCSKACRLILVKRSWATRTPSFINMRYRPRLDTNHHLILDVFKAHGIAILDLTKLGGGVPDCAVWVWESWQFVEIKNPKNTYGRKGLNPIQKQWINRWQGGPVYVIRTPEEAEAFVNKKLDKIETIKSGWNPEMAGTGRSTP